MSTPLLFRRHGDQGWRVATTLNVSHSGVLFRADGPAPALGSALEFVLTLPFSDVAQGSQLRCAGCVVRTVSNEATNQGCAVAITIADYAFLRRAPV